MCKQFFYLTNMDVSERNLDGENSVRRRSRKKSMSGTASGAREHKEQLQKLQDKVRLVALLFLRTFYHYEIYWFYFFYLIWLFELGLRSIMLLVLI